MATDFAVFLHRFLTSHLAGLRGCSPNTIASYRDTFKLLIAFFRNGRSIPPDKLTLDLIDAAAITGFLAWLQAERHNSIPTRNQRLAAISSFFRWLQSQDPASMAACQDILAVPAKKKAQPGVNHLTVEQTRRLLAQPDRSTRRGRRDATLLATSTTPPPGWVFGDRDTGAYLPKPAWTTITRHTLVKAGASPDDPDQAEYWAQRRRKVTPPLDSYTARPAIQAGRCTLCGENLLIPDQPPQTPRAGNGGTCG
jgi:hypothetical protein